MAETGGVSRAERGTPVAGSDAAPRPTLLPWLALLVAFSPVIVDLAGHQLANPWARYALWFPLLLALCIGARSGPVPARRVGALLLGAGLALELFGVFAGAVRLGRPGLVLGAIGTGLCFGLARPRELLLAIFAIPVPAALMRAVSPALPEALLAVATLPLDSDGGLGLGFADSGLPLVALLAGLSWYHSLRARLPWPRAVARAALWALLGLPLQVAILAVAAAGLTLGIDAATAWPLHASWLLVAPIGIAASGIALRADREPA